MRYTITHLREQIATFNELYPLKEPNGYGTLDRFKIDAAYGGYQVCATIPGSTGLRPITAGFQSARATANEFHTIMFPPFTREELLD